MSHLFEDSEQLDDFFLADLEELPVYSGRKTIRYVRNDIEVRLFKKYFFFFEKIIDAQLEDISTRGVLVKTLQKIDLEKKIKLELTFTDGKVFLINGLVVRESDTLKFHYGIKFNKQENNLGDYLLQTQTDLIFK